MSKGSHKIVIGLLKSVGETRIISKRNLNNDSSLTDMTSRRKHNFTSPPNESFYQVMHISSK